MKKIIVLILATLLVFGFNRSALAERESPGTKPAGITGSPETAGAPDAGPGGPGNFSGARDTNPGAEHGPERQESDMAGTGNAVNTKGLISVTDNQITSNETLSSFITQSGEETVISELSYSSNDYSSTLISVSDSSVSIRNSTVEMTVDDPVAENEQAGTAVYADSGTTVIENSEISVDGAGRYSIAATGTATMVVKNSVISAGGDSGAGGCTSAISEPASNAGLLIAGTSRANFSVGQSHTFYYDSLCTADGWAALSTDSASGSGLEFVAVNTEAAALHGGYGIYSDTSCRDYLYGCTLVSAEVGGIISNNGSILIGSYEDADTAMTQDGYSVMPYTEEVSDTGNGRSVIIAGRNDFQLHSPDMMGDGTSDYSAVLTLNSTDLITDSSINAEGYEFMSSVSGESFLVQADTDYTEKYGEAVGAYVDYVSGAAILIKSTSTDIELNDVTVDSYSGTAVLSTLNSDSMSRYLKEDVGNGVHISVEDSEIKGDFIHDDYQRDMEITLNGSTLSGSVTYSSAEEWNSRWAEYASDDTCCWAGLDSSVYVTDNHETTLTLTGGSVWTVTGQSGLTQLRVSADSVIEGNVAAERTETLDDGTVVYYNAVVTNA